MRFMETAWSWVMANAGGLTATASLVTATVALAATFAAVRYYRQYHEEVLQKNTMDLLGKLESDPVINESLAYLHEARERNNGDYAPVENTETKFHVRKVLNYFEDIAYRMERGIVDRKAVENQFRELIVLYVDVFVKNKENNGRKCSANILEPTDLKGWECLIKLHDQWAEPPV